MTTANRAYNMRPHDVGHQSANVRDAEHARSFHPDQRLLDLFQDYQQALVAEQAAQKRLEETSLNGCDEALAAANDVYCDLIDARLELVSLITTERAKTLDGLCVRAKILRDLLGGKIEVSEGHLTDEAMMFAIARDLTCLALEGEPL